MFDFYCVLMVSCLVIGLILGRWRVKVYCGDILVTPDGESCTFSLDIPREEIPEHDELVFRVVRKDSGAG